MENNQEPVKSLQYYKENAEEDYKSVPISVLKYISELEKENIWINPKDTLPDVGEEHNVVWDLHDGMGPPVVTTMEFDFKEKKWIDPQTQNDETDNVLRWRKLPEIPIELRSKS